MLPAPHRFRRPEVQVQRLDPITMAHLVLPRACSATPPRVGEATVDRSADAARIFRTNLLIVGALAMGGADLLCTLAYVTSIGMVELNPIARHMVQIGGAGQLVMYKLFTMSLSSGCIFLIRRNHKAEWCAWFCFAVMLWLTLHWVQYNQVAPELTSEFALLACHAHVQPSDGWMMVTN